MCVMAGVMNVVVNVCIDVDKESCCKDGGGQSCVPPRNICLVLQILFSYSIRLTLDVQYLLCYALDWRKRGVVWYYKGLGHSLPLNGEPYGYCS